MSKQLKKFHGSKWDLTITQNMAKIYFVEVLFCINIFILPFNGTIMSRENLKTYTKHKIHRKHTQTLFLQNERNSIMNLMHVICVIVMMSGSGGQNMILCVEGMLMCLVLNFMNAWRMISIETFMIILHRISAK